MKTTRRTPGPFEGGSQKVATEKLFFLQDLMLGNKTVYSGHSGSGRTFKMYQSDYGKYAMKPATEKECEILKNKIIKAANGKHIFDWNIIPITDIDLCNFYEQKEYDAFKKLQQEQIKIVTVKVVIPVICDGCNVRDGWEHRCHGHNIVVNGTFTNKKCECDLKSCKHQQK